MAPMRLARDWVNFEATVAVFFRLAEEAGVLVGVRGLEGGVSLAKKRAEMNCREKIMKMVTQTFCV